MTKSVKPIPDGYHQVTAYLVVKGAAEALTFYQKAFGAIERMRFTTPAGTIGHAEIMIGESCVMLADEYPEMNCIGPKTLGGTSVSLMVYVEDVDHFVERAVNAGAKVLRPVQDMFYGDRTGTLEDPFGHQWHIATHIEDLTQEELEERAKSHM